jgi:hypothetical protein
MLQEPQPDFTGMAQEICHRAIIRFRAARDERGASSEPVGRLVCGAFAFSGALTMGDCAARIAKFKDPSHMCAFRFMKKAYLCLDNGHLYLFHGIESVTSAKAATSPTSFFCAFAA